MQSKKRSGGAAKPRRRRVFESAFRAKVALAAVRGERTLAELAGHFELHANQVSQWRQTLVDRAADLFEDGRRRPAEETTDVEELYAPIGRLKMELEWLKKKLPTDSDARRRLIEPDHPELSVRRQCDLLGLPRSTCYYQPCAESPFNLRLMRMIDEQHLRTPTFGARMMTAWLRIAPCARVDQFLESFDQTWLFGFSRFPASPGRGCWLAARAIAMRTSPRNGRTQTAGSSVRNRISLARTLFPIQRKRTCGPAILDQ